MKFLRMFHLHCATQIHTSTLKVKGQKLKEKLFDRKAAYIVRIFPT